VLVNEFWGLTDEFAGILKSLKTKEVWGGWMGHPILGKTG
jgi:hypothetical protein